MKLNAEVVWKARYCNVVLGDVVT